MGENSKELTDLQKEQIDVWLAEYEACQSNRDHFDSTYWIIATVFLAASFTIIGLSFQESIIDNGLAVSFLTLFSVFLFTILYLYNWSIQRYIDRSYERMREIEKAISDLGLDMKLHTSINSDFPKGRGRKIFLAITTGFFSFCALRIAILLFAHI